MKMSLHISVNFFVSFILVFIFYMRHEMLISIGDSEVIIEGSLQGQFNRLQMRPLRYIRRCMLPVCNFQFKPWAILARRLQLRIAIHLADSLLRETGVY
jgi:hypothetical protein